VCYNPYPELIAAMSATNHAIYQLRQLQNATANGGQSHLPLNGGGKWGQSRTAHHILQLPQLAARAR